MAEYRLSELSELSGVSSRNIRAYRERGLLDPPRREGRAAIYDDRHLSQLKTINELLRRGYTSAHIAEFFDTMRRGQDLADILGLQESLFGRQRPADDRGTANTVAAGEAAERLEAIGLVRRDDAGYRWNDDALADLVAAADEPADYRATALRVSEGIADLVDAAAAAIVTALQEGLAARYGPKYVPRPEHMDELRRLVTDYRRLANRVVVTQLDAALRRRLVDALAEYTTDVIAGADPGP